MTAFIPGLELARRYYRNGIRPLDWLATPGQQLAEFTGGGVFHDGLGDLQPAREAPRWYPDDFPRARRIVRAALARPAGRWPRSPRDTSAPRP
ncbi:DUF4037 domain-containing protein [Nonomuraea typhae]|uniref:DUF4037 domain-containing protein n=1 Tax=Nonomuraea typhae TaxID=2603600 RepID=A0ABW7YMX8_9ACTN